MKIPFLGRFHSRDKPQNAVSAAPTFYFGTSGAGKNVNPKNAVQVSAVYACVRVIAETIASLPLNVFESTDTGSEKATGHPLYRLLHDEPNSEMTSFIWRETMLSHLLLWGNSYCQIIRSGRNRIVGLYPLLPDRMEVDRDSKGSLTYTYTTTDGKPVALKSEDVLHIPGLGFDGIVGYSPIALEKNAIGLGIAAEEYGSRFFQNGARPSGILTHPNTVKDPKRLRESWNAAYGGSGNSGKVAILEEAMTFTPISMPNNEAQFLETRKFQVEEICRIFRVPAHLIGDLDHATFSNIEHMSIDFAVHTIRPWLVRIEQAMNRALFLDTEKGRFFVQFNLDGLMRGDYKSRMEGYAIARQNGWMSANDIRELENMNPLPEEEGGSAYLINGNMIPITLAGINLLTAAMADMSFTISVKRSGRTY
ncbi:MAG: phage portal protein [Eubacteriales bacterium]|nr:phage portal protein [Eubacteriales bacterium]MDD4513423.1 phage portal protein [Eubacteriales bacterium]